MRSILIAITVLISITCCTDQKQKELMRHSLLTAKEQNENNQPFTTDSVMKDVTKYYDRHGSRNEQMLAHYLLGCTYRDLGDAPRALQCYNDAVNKADTTNPDCDYATMSRIYGQMDDLFNKELQPHNQLKALELCHRYAMKAGDTLMAIIAYDSKSIAYHLLDDIDAEIAISEKASQMFKKYGYKEFAAMSLGMIIQRYVELGDWKNAERCIRIYEKESGVFDNDGNIEPGREIFYFEKGLYFLNIARTDSAEYYFRKLLNNHREDINNRIAAYRGLSLLYRQKCIPDSTAKYAILGYEANDTMCINIMKASLPKIQALYDYGHYKEEALIKSEEANRAYIITSALIFISVIVLIVLGMKIYLIRRNRKADLERQKAEYEHKIAMLKNIQNDMNVMLTENKEKLKELIEEKQDIISKLEKEIASYCTDNNFQEEQLINADITRHFQMLAKDATLPTSDDWHEIRNMIDEILPKFKTTLNNGTHTLRMEEYHICILVRLDFKPLEISNLTGLSQANITAIRKRMLKKLFGIDGKPKEFDTIISKIK